MFDKSDIRAAVEGGAISDEAAKRLEAFLKARNDPDRMLDPENLRFLSNFNDIFLSIGIVILITGLGFLSWIAASNIFGVSAIFEGGEPAPDMINRLKMAMALVPALLIVGAWLLAEYFCGKRRLLLPSMALSVAIVSSAAALMTILMMPTTDAEIERASDVEGMFFGLSYAGFGAATFASAAIFWRFRLPFSLFLLAGSIAGLFYTLVWNLLGGDQVFSGATMLGAGIATLVVAIWFDMRDPMRSSRTSDHAFWLHLAAAPQIIWGARELVIGSGLAPAGPADATVMLILLVAFGVFSLAINRRALIVSGLLTFGGTLWVLVDAFGGGSGDVLTNVMLTALIVGGAIVLLGGGWRTARRALLKLIPSQGLTGRIFPPEPA